MCTEQQLSREEASINYVTDWANVIKHFILHWTLVFGNFNINLSDMRATADARTSLFLSPSDKSSLKLMLLRLLTSNYTWKKAIDKQF